jgi:hypothetical protein
MCSTYGVARKVIEADPQLDSAQILVGGEWILYSYEQQSGSELMLAENFR